VLSIAARNREKKLTWFFSTPFSHTQKSECANCKNYSHICFLSVFTLSLCFWFTVKNAIQNYTQEWHRNVDVFVMRLFLWFATCAVAYAIILLLLCAIKSLDTSVINKCIDLRTGGLKPTMAAAGNPSPHYPAMIATRLFSHAIFPDRTQTDIRSMLYAVRSRHG